MPKPTSENTDTHLEYHFSSTSESDDENEVYETALLLELIQDNDLEGLKQYLLDHPSCDVNVHDMYYNYPVTLAASNNHFPILDTLYAAGASFDVKDDTDRSPYDYAVENNNEAMQAYILERLEDVSYLQPNI